MWESTYYLNIVEVKLDGSAVVFSKKEKKIIALYTLIIWLREVLEMQNFCYVNKTGQKEHCETSEAYEKLMQDKWIYKA